MAGPVVLSTGVIENRASNAQGRAVRHLVVRVENNTLTSATSEGTPIVIIEVFRVTPSTGGFATQSTYALDQVSLGDVNQPDSVWTLDNLFADLDAFGVRATITSTGSTLTELPTVTVFGKDAEGRTIQMYPVYTVTSVTAPTVPSLAPDFESLLGQVATVGTPSGSITGEVTGVGIDYVQITESNGDIVLIPFTSVNAVY